MGDNEKLILRWHQIKSRQLCRSRIDTDNFAEQRLPNLFTQTTSFTLAKIFLKMIHRWWRQRMKINPITSPLMMTRALGAASTYSCNQLLFLHIPAIVASTNISSNDVHSDTDIKLPKRKQEQQKRMHGKQYLGFRKVFDSKTGLMKQKQEALKLARKIGLRCTASNCKKFKNRLIHCDAISDVERLAMFKHFWEFSWREKNLCQWSGQKMRH